MYGDLANPEYAETFNGIFSRYKEFSTVRGEPGAQMINAAAKAQVAINIALLSLSTGVLAKSTGFTPRTPPPV